MRKIVIFICFILVLCSCSSSNENVKPIHDTMSFTNINIKNYTDKVVSIRVANDPKEITDPNAIEYAISIINSYEYIPYRKYFELFYNSDFYYLKSNHSTSRYNIEFVRSEGEKFFLIFNTSDNRIIIYYELDDEFTILMSTEQYTYDEFKHFKMFDFGLGYEL